MRTQLLIDEMETRWEKYSAARDIIDSLIISANWYLIDDPTLTEEGGKREPDLNNDDEKYSALRYEAYCVAIEAVRKWAEK